MSFQEGTEDGETADEYIKVTVYLASVLFLVGISTQFRVKRARGIREVPQLF